jgi:hypothetical protein
LIKTHRTKGASILVFAQKPTLIHEACVTLSVMENRKPLAMQRG